jgi:hypothetical protein
MKAWADEGKERNISHLALLLDYRWYNSESSCAVHIENRLVA